MALVYFKALSDETRLRLVHILLHYELSVNELVRILGMGQSRVSRHLKILTEAGLLTSRRDGLWVFYAATRCGEASDFLQAMGPFLHTDTAMREDLAFLQQSLKTVLHDYAEIFKKRFSEGLSIRKTADALQMNRGAVERRQNALYLAFAALLRQRDEADGICRLSQKNKEDRQDTTE